MEFKSLLIRDFSTIEKETLLIRKYPFKIKSVIFPVTFTVLSEMT